MSEFKDLKELDFVFYVPNNGRRRDPQQVRVNKIGRKWVYTCNGNMRFDIATGEVDGGNYSSPGRCYKDIAAYESVRARDRLYSQLTRNIGWSAKDGVTADDIRQAIRLLRIEFTEADK